MLWCCAHDRTTGHRTPTWVWSCPKWTWLWEWHSVTLEAASVCSLSWPVPFRGQLLSPGLRKVLHSPWGAERGEVNPSITWWSQWEREGEKVILSGRRKLSLPERGWKLEFTGFGLCLKELGALLSCVVDIGTHETKWLGNEEEMWI